MNNPRINIVCRVLFGLAVVLPGQLQAQQPYPSKPVRIVTGAPGVPHDLIPRLIQPKLAEYLGQAIVIENKAAGPGGVITGGEVAKATPDGHTLLSGADTLSIAHHLLKQIPYDGLNAFAPVKMLVSAPPVLVVNPGFAAKNLSEFLANAKSNPGKVTLGTSTPGSRGHIAAAVLASETGLDFTLVPFRAGGPVVLALVSGDINATFVVPSAVMQYVRSGKARPLAVASKTRFFQVPDVPPVADLIPGFEVFSWFGMVAPAKTPKDVVTRLHREITRALMLPDNREKIVAMGFEVGTSTPEEFGAFMQAESDKFGKVIRQYKITAD